MTPSIRRKLVAFTAPAVLAASMIVTGAPAAHADVPNCVAVVRKTADVVATQLLTKTPVLVKPNALLNLSINDVIAILATVPITGVVSYCP